MKDTCHVTIVHGYHIDKDDACYKEISSIEDQYCIDDTSFTVIRRTNTFDKEHIYISLEWTSFDEHNQDDCYDVLMEKSSKKAICKFKEFCKKRFGLSDGFGYHVAFSYE